MECGGVVWKWVTGAPLLSHPFLILCCWRRGQAKWEESVPHMRENCSFPLKMTEVVKGAPDGDSFFYPCHLPLVTCLIFLALSQLRVWFSVAACSTITNLNFFLRAFSLLVSKSSYLSHIIRLGLRPPTVGWFLECMNRGTVPCRLHLPSS